MEHNLMAYNNFASRMVATLLLCKYIENAMLDEHVEVFLWRKRSIVL